jgi:hypothetical protein
LALLMRSPGLPKLEQMPSLNFEKSALDGGGATQPPKHASKPEHQFSFYCLLRIIVCSDRHFEGGIVLSIFQDIDHRFCSQPMAERIPPRPILACFGGRTGTGLSIATVGID